MCEKSPSPETCMTCSEVCQRRFPLIGTGKVMRQCACGEMFITFPKSPRRHCSQMCYRRDKYANIPKSKGCKWTAEMNERWDAAMRDTLASARASRMLGNAFSIVEVRG